ncbi:MAG: HK97 family phage prohead protease [Gammaproteobacteria bacterium]
MDDIIVKGAFAGTLGEHRARDRQIRMLFQHNRSELIGGFPSELAREDGKGLFIVGHINLDTQTGREAFSLMKQGVLEDMSIGFIILDSEMQDGKQLIKEIKLFEISLVAEPANIEAQITAIKSVLPFKDLPLADIRTPWNKTDGLRKFIDEDGVPGDTYGDAFLWCDREAEGELASYKLPIATVIDDELVVIPKAVFAAAAMLSTPMGMGIPSRDRPDVIKNIERYYEKMGRESPFEKGFCPDEMKTLSRGDLVKFLRSQPPLSKAGAEYLAQGIMGGSGDQVAEKQADGLQHLHTTLQTILKKDQQHA